MKHPVGIKSFVKIFAAAALAGATSIAAAAAGPWIQTSSGQDDPDGADPVLYTEYVLPKSVKVLSGNYRAAFVKVTFAPGVRDSAEDAMTTTISETIINCADLSWGDVNEIVFDENMTPIMPFADEFDQKKGAWTTKNMQKLNSSDVSYRTAQYICDMAH